MNRLGILSSFIVVPVLFLQGCAPATLLATESLTGSLVGTLGGSAVGLFFAESQDVSKTTENILVNGAIGAGIGLLAGAYIHQQNLEIAKERAKVEKEYQLLRENQTEIDELRKKVYDSSSWGANESRPWKERYRINTESDPYQGPV